jgi:ankyrin repeat protein
MNTHFGSLCGYFSTFKWVLVVVFLLVAFARGGELAPIERLHDACRRSDLEEVRALLRDGALDVNAVAGGWPERTALHCAVQGRASRKAERLAIATELLDRGADVNAIAKNGQSVFETAIEPGWDEALLELLIARGANLNGHPVSRGLNSYAGHPLHRAAARCDLELTAFLLSHKADPNIPHPGDRDTPLMRIFGMSTGVWEWQVFSAENLRTAAFKTMCLLLDHGADLHQTNQRGETVLHRAAGANHLQCVRELVSRGAAADARTADGRSVVHFAAGNEKFHDRAVLTTLLNLSRLDINVTDNAGNTPLHRAVRTSSSLAVQSLLLLGANPAVLNRDNKRPDELEGYDHLDSATRDMLRRYLPPEKSPSRKTPTQLDERPAPLRISL